MSYICIECGAEFDYKEIFKHKLKCISCKEKRSNIWIKKRPLVSQKVVITR